MVVCIVMDGFHKGHVINFPRYLPVLRLPRQTVAHVDYCCGGDEILREPPSVDEYKATFHAVDRKVVVYSEKGDSIPIFESFEQIFTSKPWHKRTLLKRGYHGEEEIAELNDQT